MTNTPSPTTTYEVVLRVTVTADDRVDAAQYGAVVIRQAIARGYGDNLVDDVEVTNKPTRAEPKSTTTFHAIADGRRLA